MKHILIPRILITLLGIAFILMAAFEVVLGITGESAIATVTCIRREGGERADGKPGRYTYNIGYSFTLPDGKEIAGFTKKIGDSVYLKADCFLQVFFPGFCKLSLQQPAREFYV